MVAHNNPIQSVHLRKKWQFHVKTWFDQPAKKQARRASRIAKAKKANPRPVYALRPVVRCQTNKYNTKARAGRGFTPAELKAAGFTTKYAQGLGVAVDFRRKNRSEEGFQVNVERLKQYKSQLVIMQSGKKARKDEVAKDVVKATVQNKTKNVFAINNTVVAEEARAPTEAELALKGKVANMLRQALMNQKLYGKRVNKYKKQLTDKAAADKKAAKNAD
eukprot:UN04604